MESKNHSQSDQDEISLKELFNVLWKGRVLIAIGTIGLTFAASITAWLMPKAYEAAVVISPVSDTSSGQLGGLSSLTSQLGGLASLAGISVGTDSKKSESLAVLQSEALTEEYIKRNDLLPVLYHEKWDEAKKTWAESDPEKIPTLWKANLDFKKKVRAIASDTKTGMVTLTITWKEPNIAAKWANDLVRMTNEFLRNKAIEQSEKNIAYLNEQAAKTDAVGVKQAIYSILQSELNKAMLARGTEEYAFKVIDPAIPPERPSYPQKLLWVLVGFAGGLFLSVFIVLVRSSSKSVS